MSQPQEHQHVFTQSGPAAACVLCGMSLLATQTLTQRPSPRQELHNKLKELDDQEAKKTQTQALNVPQVGAVISVDPETLLPPPKHPGYVRLDEHREAIQGLYSALANAVAALEERLKEHVREALATPL